MINGARADVPRRNGIAPPLSIIFPSRMSSRAFIAVLALVLAVSGIVRAQESLGDVLGAPGFRLSDPQQRAQVVARIRAVLRRTAGGGRPLSASSVLVADELRVDRTSRRASVGGRSAI